jgi:hypothetical protein
MGPRSFKIQITDPKTWSAHTKIGLAYNFCFIKFLLGCPVEAVDAPQNLFMARSRRSIPDKVCYWEGALQLWFNKLCQKMINHGSRSTRGPGPSRSGLWAQKYDLPPLKWSFPTTFVFIKVLPRLTVKAVDTLQTLFRVPWPWWSGYKVETMLRTFSRCSVNCLITIWSTYHLIEWGNWLTVQWMDIWSNPNWPKVIWSTVL